MGGKFWQHCVLTLALVVGACWGHGRLVEPPSRASAWRFGFDVPIDYNDNQGFCGGRDHQQNTQDGRCGICGDAWDENPRPHEAGGIYATGTIVRMYTKGQTITARVNITKNHGGHFEFRICPNNNPSVEASETCLDEHRLLKADGSGFKHQISSITGVHAVQLQLPQELTCTQCVMQWRYVTGNHWGDCGNGTGALGCGPQEEFRACADVAVVAQTGGLVINPIPSTTTPQPEPAPTGCRPVGPWNDVAGMHEWCAINCQDTPPNCPPTYCTCD
ncbi:uncharacterized protein LOC134780271 isoform X2 [Penaeus indicus]